MTDTYTRLSEPFPQEMEKVITKSGVNLTYIPVSEVINRLNKVMGFDKWSYSIVSCGRDASDLDFVLAHVRIDYFPSGSEMKPISRDGFGGQKIKRTKQGAIVDLGDEFKGAISDALKKAAQAFGVGLYLARTEDAMEIEQAIDASNAPISEHEQRWESFKTMSKSLTKEQREQISSAWASEYGDKPKPTSANDVDDETLNFLIAHAMSAKLSGPGATSGE
jgi:hypothetical protein